MSKGKSRRSSGEENSPENLWRFDERILPGTAVRDPDLFDTRALQEMRNAQTEDLIVVPEEILRLVAERSGFSQVLDGPLHRRIGGHRKVNHFPR